ncbi:MAG: YibE/F family protein, partial [Planctomycetota bacterium]
FSTLVVGGVLLLFYGWDRKALAALAGTVGALAVVVAVTAAASHGLKLTGLDTPGARYLVELFEHPPHVRFDYRGLLLAGLLVAVLGVAIDTSVSIAAGIEELYRTHPGIERRAAFASGLAIGRDVMGVCATTFVFASVGVRLPLLLMPAAADLTPAEVVNTEAGCVVVVRLLAGGIGLLATAPLTTLAAVALFSRPATGRRRTGLTRGRAIAGIAACLVGAAALGVLVARTPPHPPVERPRFESLDAGSFEAVEKEANALLEDYGYPQAILLLWRAADRGIGGITPHLVLAELYRDYLRYLRYYEQEGLPERVRRRWAATTTAAAQRAWMVHRIAEYEAALRLEPDHPRVHQGLGRLLCQADRPAEAIPHYRAALDATPDDVDLLCDLAIAYTRTGQPDRADPLAARLERLAPDHPRVRQLLGRLRPPARE